MLSVLNNSINNENKTSIYISKLRIKNIKVLPPDINISNISYIINNGNIYAPLSIIRNVGNNIANVIISERNKGQFISFSDFVKRIYNKSVNHKVLESLILSGVFNSFGYNKKTLMLNLDNVLNYAELASDNSLIQVEEPIIDIIDEYSKEELINFELESFGFYLSDHPVSKYKSYNSLNTLNISDNVNKYINIIVEIVSIKEVITKKNDVMAFIKGRDEYKDIELTLFPDKYKEYNEIKKYDIVNIYGKVEKRLDNYQIIVNKMIKLN